jgi:hypothetical protein
MTDLALKAEQSGPTMPGYHAALTREILVTERLRIKAVLATILLFGAVLKGYDQPQTVWKLGL